MCVYYMTGVPEGSPKVVLWRSRESNLRPWFTRHRFIPYITAASLSMHLNFKASDQTIYHIIYTLNRSYKWPLYIFLRLFRK